MVDRSLEHLPLYERVRLLRLAKAFTQTDVAHMLNKSQAYVSLLENGRRSPYDARQCLKLLESHRVNRKRNPGGDFKVGRLRSRYPLEAARFRGEPLAANFDHASTLPREDAWRIIAICRTGAEAELAFLFNDDQEIFGLVGFHQIGHEIRRGRIIPISAELDQDVAEALEAFAHANIELEGRIEEPDALPTDDGVLGDDDE